LAARLGFWSPVRVHGSLLRDVAMPPESSDDWRWKARRVLSRFGPRAIPALVEALSTGEDPTIRRFAADSLALLGTDAHDASDALRHAAWHDEDSSVREAAAAALDAVAERRSSQ
jgi:HEAT repeat protein